MKTALYQKRLISAEEGVDIRDSQGEQPDFRCTECGEAARVEKAGGHMPNRFEHLERNSFCALVHRPR